MPSGVYQHLPLGTETRRRMSIAKKGNHNALGAKRTQEFKSHLRRIRSGPNCNFWKGGLTRINKTIRRLPEYALWRHEVFERDRWRCTKCHRTNCELHPHHIKPFAIILKEQHIIKVGQAIACKPLWDVDNGLTLCPTCHRTTKSYGRN